MFSPIDMPDNYNIIILTYFQLYLKLRKIIKTFVFFKYFFNTFIIFDYYIIIYYSDNGNEGTCCNFTSMFQTMFSSMFSSMFTRDRGFIFILTNIFEILKIYLGNFLETYLYHTCTEEYKPSITSKHT